MENMLTKNELSILAEIDSASKQHVSQRKIAVSLGLSLGTVNKAYNLLAEKGCIKDSRVTDDGYAAMEPYRVRRAVFLAAGFGTRLVPITFNTPKPLVRVHGVRIIDTLLDAVIAAGIPEIVIVRGYLGEQFDQLLYKYPQIRFLDNAIYNEANNISSALCAKDLMQNAYIMEADLVLYRPGLIRRYEYESNILGFPVDRSDDWCLMTNRSGIITNESVGGVNCHQMIGISYWNAEDGDTLSRDIEDVFYSPGGRERYWEQVPFVYRKEHYHVHIRECEVNDVIEIDTFNELKAIDPLYAT